MNKFNFLVYSISACEDITILKIILFIKKILNLATIAIPIILILMITLDFLKNILVNKEEDMKKNTQLVIKRIIYTIVIFLVPTIVNFTIEVLGNFNTNYQKCLQVTEESIENQKEENKNKCQGDDYTWDDTTYQCLINPKVPETPNIITEKKKIINSNTNTTTEDGNLIYYNQGDYSRVKFCSSGVTVSSSGCGATSLAIIASSFSNKKYDPKNVATWLCNNGHIGHALGENWFTKKKVLNHFNLSVTTLFDNGNYKGNSGKTYNKTQANKILNAVKEGKGVVLYIPEHYVVVGPNKKCNSNQVYLYDVGKRAYNGCYTPKELFEKVSNYKNKCKNLGNCGWKKAWAFTKK